MELREHIRNAYVVLFGARFVLHVCYEDFLASSVDGESCVFRPRKLLRMHAIYFLYLSFWNCACVFSSVLQVSSLSVCRRVGLGRIEVGFLMCSVCAHSN